MHDVLAGQGAEAEGFEPPDPCGSLAFKAPRTATLDVFWLVRRPTAFGTVHWVAESVDGLGEVGADEHFGAGPPEPELDALAVHEPQPAVGGVGGVGGDVVEGAGLARAGFAGGQEVLVDRVRRPLLHQVPPLLHDARSAPGGPRRAWRRAHLDDTPPRRAGRRPPVPRGSWNRSVPRPAAARMSCQYFDASGEGHGRPRRRTTEALTAHGAVRACRASERAVKRRP